MWGGKGLDMPDYSAVQRDYAKYRLDKLKEEGICRMNNVFVI